MVKVLLVAFGIMGVCVVIHITGLVTLGQQLASRREKIEKHITFGRAALLLIIVFGAIVFLHVLEATIWAGFFYWGGLFPNFELALYCSLTSYSTAGYGDVLLPPHWRLLGTIEAISGVLLCGLSGAFLFAVVNAIFQFRGLREDSKNQT
jgi:ion channel